MLASNPVRMLLYIIITELNEITEEKMSSAVLDTAPGLNYKFPALDLKSEWFSWKRRRYLFLKVDD